MSSAAKKRYHRKVTKRPNQLAAERLVLKLADYANISSSRTVTERQRRKIAKRAEDIEQLHILNMSIMAGVLTFLEVNGLEWEEGPASSLVTEAAILPYLKRVDDWTNTKVMARLDAQVVRFDLYTTFLRYLVAVSLAAKAPPPPPVAPPPGEEEAEESEEEGEYDEEGSEEEEGTEEEDEDEERGDRYGVEGPRLVPTY
jgi:hypothetical protein